MFEFSTMVALSCSLMIQPADEPVAPGDLEPFLDEFFGEQLEALDVPGAVVAVVQDDQVVLQKGFGIADLQRGQPMDPQRTVFRVGSLTKLFTASAVMQLEEAGFVDLDRDINDYTGDVQLAETFAGPVTLAHLLTHTAGLDQRNIGTAARTRADQAPLADYLHERMPPRVRPAGQVFSYSNHGMALAGLAVEEASGLAYEAYVQTHLLEPLGMSHSGFEIPQGNGVQAAIAYHRVGGAQVPWTHDYPRFAPAAGLHTTADDMTRFMRWQLAGGEIDGKRNLSVESVRRMQARQFAQHPALPGTGFGYLEYPLDDRRGIGHTGDWRGFSAMVLLLPEENTGLFVAYNAEQPQLRDLLVEAFMKRFFPAAESPSLPAIDQTVQRASELAGEYRHTRVAQGTVDKLGALVGFAPTYRVRDNGDGSLTILETRFVPVEPLLYRTESGETTLAFGRDDGGDIAYLFIDRFAHEKLPWSETGRIQGLHAGACALLFLSAFTIGPLGWFGTRRRAGRQAKKGWPGRAQGLARPAAWLLSTMYLVFFCGAGVALAGTGPHDIGYGLPALLQISLWIPLIAAPLCLVPVALAATAWVRGWWGIPARVHYSAVAFAGVAVLLFLARWNLLGFHT